jgi:hypothetical protein
MNRQIFSCGFNFWGARGQEDRRDVKGHVELGGGVPSGAVEQQHDVGALGDVAGDFLEMELHGLGVGDGQRERGPDASSGANGAKEVRAFVALTGGLPAAAIASLQKSLLPSAKTGPLQIQVLRRLRSAAIWAGICRLRPTCPSRSPN